MRIQSIVVDIHTPTFLGSMLCPLTVFTLGMLLLLKTRIPFFIVIIPILYSLGSIIPISLGIYEDI